MIIKDEADKMMELPINIIEILNKWRIHLIRMYSFFFLSEQWYNNKFNYKGVK
jgi:hypothetical protein